MRNPMSLMCVMPPASSSSPEIADTDSGISCSDSLRLRAVTMISSRTSFRAEVSSAATDAHGSPSATAQARSVPDSG